MENLIKGQSIQAQQSDEVNDGRWVLKSEDNELLYEIQSKWSNRDLIEALTIMKKFELTAFNVGIAHGKSLMKDTTDKIIDAKNSQIKFLEELNERLAGHLERLAGQESSMTDEEFEKQEQIEFDKMLEEKEATLKRK